MFPKKISFSYIKSETSYIFYIFIFFPSKTIIDQLSQMFNIGTQSTIDSFDDVQCSDV